MDSNDILKTLTTEPGYKDAPKATGVYLMYDEKGKVIYVGKANNLKQRMQQYFRPGGDGRRSVPFLIEKVRKIEFRITGNEARAFFLEDRLIKEYKPHYNVLRKDDKSYPSLELTLLEDFPRLIPAHRHLTKGSRYFGPFVTGVSPAELLQRYNDRFKLRRCSVSQMKKGKPCLYAQIGRCCAPCAGLVSKEEYAAFVSKITDSLRRYERNQIKVEEEAKEELKKDEAGN